jgi:hypothetical protein
VDEQRCPCRSTKAHRTPSRCHTSRHTAAGTCRDRVAGTVASPFAVASACAFAGAFAFAGVPAFVVRGVAFARVLRASVRSSSCASAREMMAAGSRSGIWCDRRSCSWHSAACVSWSTVTRIWYRRGASGATSARGPAGAGAARPGARSSGGPVVSGAISCGSAATREVTSGRGAISATSFSMCRLLRCRARARSSAWLSSVRASIEEDLPSTQPPRSILAIHFLHYLFYYRLQYPPIIISPSERLSHPCGTVGQSIDGGGGRRRTTNDHIATAMPELRA